MFNPVTYWFGERKPEISKPENVKGHTSLWHNVSVVIHPPGAAAPAQDFAPSINDVFAPPPPPPPYSQEAEAPPLPPEAPGDVPVPPVTVLKFVFPKNNQQIKPVAEPLAISFGKELEEQIKSRQQKPNGDIAVLLSMKKPQENKDALTLQEQLKSIKKPNGEAVVKSMKKPQESKGDPMLSDELAAKFERMRLRNSSKS